MGTGRLETFADGVFAIAATLLILSIDERVGSSSSNLGRQLIHIWPSYVGYGVSFLTIGIMWANHHTLMHQLARADRVLVMLTIGLLLCIAFVPFPTRLVAEHIRDNGVRPAALAYGATMTIAALMFFSIWLYASRGGRLLRTDADPRAVRGITRSYLPGVPLYLGSTLIAFASPIVSVVLYGLIAVFFVFESSLFGGRLAPVDEEEPSG